MIFVPLLHPGLWRVTDGCLCWDNLGVEFFVLAMEKVALISYLLCLLGGDSPATFPCAVNRSCTHPGIIQDPTSVNKVLFFSFSPPRFIALPPKSAALLCVFLKNCKWTSEMFYSVLLWLCHSSQASCSNCGECKGRETPNQKNTCKKKPNFFEEVINLLWDVLAWSKAFIGAHCRCHRWINHLWHCHLQIMQILEAFFYFNPDQQ